MKRLYREKKTIEKMVILYCKNHHVGQAPCSECSQLIDYALNRVEKCKFGDNKPTCAKCTIHCYRKNERETIRNIMRYSGPRMIIHHPYLALMHLIDGMVKREND